MDARHWFARRSSSCNVSLVPRIRKTASSSAFLLLIAPVIAGGFGPSGHRIAGLAAEPMLCGSTRSKIDDLTRGETLAEIGHYADRIRGDRRWAHSAPWHYLNVADDEDLRDFEHPAEGDVLWAIETFSRRLGDLRLSRADREMALKFLVHFVVDIHQPLHVGRAADRGGNEIQVRYDAKAVNLHRFWDTDAIALAGLSDARYVASMMPDIVGISDREAAAAPRIWAQESRQLRQQVYAFDRASGELSEEYRLEAERITRARLAIAAVRLSVTLNRILCD